jgi:hypothetical protein
MRIGEQYSTLGQSVEIWRVNIFATAEAVDPVVEVVDCNEQHIRASMSGFGGGCEWGQAGHRNET